MVCQESCQTVGNSVQLLIGIALIFEYQSRCSRNLFCFLAEKTNKSLCFVEKQLLSSAYSCELVVFNSCQKRYVNQSDLFVTNSNELLKYLLITMGNLPDEELGVSVFLIGYLDM